MSIIKQTESEDNHKVCRVMKNDPDSIQY